MIRRGLDLYSCAGGASVGYDRAGFQMTGVDIRPQPHYPFEFIEANALAVLDSLTADDGRFGLRLEDFDFIHASPTCQTFARVTAWRGSREDHPDLLTPTLGRLSRLSIPWVVENVREACPPLRPDLILCGSHFDLNVHRERAFQLGNWSSYELLPPCQCRRNRDLIPFGHKNERAFADAMGCTWMPKEQARQAVPPAYTEHIGSLLLAFMAASEAA